MESKAKDILDKYQYFIFDCDGVLWTQDQAIPGAVEFIKHLKELGKEVFFVTNNSTRSREAVFEYAKGLGFTEEANVALRDFYPA